MATRKALAVVLVPLVLLGVPAMGDCQKGTKIPRIGILWLSPENAPRLDEFRKGLRDLGYVDGKNILIEYRKVEGEADQLPELAAELVRLKPKVILAEGGEVIEALRSRTKTIPIVIPVMTDPVRSGFVASVDRPEGNITGLTNLSPELSGKRLELLKETVPTVTRVAVLWRSVPG